MKNLIMDIKHILSGYNFFNDKYLRNIDFARESFAAALKKARQYYDGKSPIKTSPELVHDSWMKNIEALVPYFKFRMNENFLLDEIINGTMVFTDKKVNIKELQNLSSVISAGTIAKIVSGKLNKAFIEGKSKKAAMINSVHHLHHLFQFEQTAKQRIEFSGDIVEFGGGYGNLARIANNMGHHRNYHIIDLLPLSCIQYVFLATVFDEKEVAFTDQATDAAKFILHPLFGPDTMNGLNCDLFISTWALSESPRKVYELVAGCDWFGAKQLLMAYNYAWKPWQDGELEASLENNGWSIKKQPISFLPGNFYLFSTR